MRINDKKLFELNNLSSKKQAWSWSKTGNFSGKKLSNKIWAKKFKYKFWKEKFERQKHESEIKWQMYQNESYLGLAAGE